MLSPFLLLASITPADVQALLRRDLPSVAISAIFVSAGVGTLVLYRLKRRSRDLALLWFGVFAVMYGVRLFATTDIATSAFQRSGWFWAYVDSSITYAIGIPVVLLLREIFPGWRPVLRILVYLLVSLTVAGNALDAIAGRPMTLRVVNNTLTLLAFAAFLAMMLRKGEKPKELKTLLGGIVLFTLTVIANNVASLLRWGLPFNPEPFGLLYLLIALGRVLAQRTLVSQERLVELDKELEIARRIQNSILPRETPSGQDLDISARYLPMSAVAGDFYDFLVVDESRVGILIADVSGHGVPAALIASMVKVAVAAQLPHADRPERVLSGMNKILCGNLQGQYVTAAYLFLDLATRRLRYAAAGHPALFWDRGDGEVEEIVENGLMLGLFPHSAYTTREAEMARGDRFLLYTDGLTEAANHEGEFFGAERLKQLLTETRRKPAYAVVDALVKRVSDWSHSAQDDLTLVAVGWRAGE